MGSALDMHHIHSEPWSNGLTILFISFMIMAWNFRNRKLLSFFLSCLSGLMLALSTILRPGSIGIFIAILLAFVIEIIWRRRKISHLTLFIPVLSATAILGFYVLVAYTQTQALGLSNIRGVQVLAKNLIIVDPSKIENSSQVSPETKAFVKAIYASTIPECSSYRSTPNVFGRLKQSKRDSYAACFNSSLIASMIWTIGKEKDTWPLNKSIHPSKQLRAYEEIQMGAFLSSEYSLAMDKKLIIVNREINFAVDFRKKVSAVAEEFVWFFLLLIKNPKILVFVLVLAYMSKFFRSLSRTRQFHSMRSELAAFQSLSTTLLLSIVTGALVVSSGVFATTRYVDFYGHLFALGLIMRLHIQTEEN
jgi:hypothetical protein